MSWLHNHFLDMNHLQMTEENVYHIIHASNIIITDFIGIWTRILSLVQAGEYL